MVDEQHDAQREASQLSVREGASNGVIGVILCEVLGREAMDCLRGRGEKSTLERESHCEPRSIICGWRVPSTSNMYTCHENRGVIIRGGIAAAL